MPHVTLTGTDISWHCEDGDTIMRAAIRSGLGFPYECNVGSCGNCRFDLVAGEVEHLRADPPGLSERDRQRGRRLGCQARPLTDCTVKARMMPHYVSRFRPVRQSATLVETRDITHDIREFRFRFETPTRFLAGQYALLSVPGVAGARAYSMCNTGEQGAEWHFQIKRVAGGAATGCLFDGLAAGVRIGVDGPYGMAYLREEAPRDIVCLAGGSGLSPMISIARAAAIAPSLADRRLDFVYGGRAARDICGQEMLEQLPGFGTRIHYHPAISEAGNQNDGWNGYRGFIHEVADELLGVRLADCEIYFAGPPAMAEAVQKMLLGRGVPPDQVHFDQFF
jgi:toluene monooxygenase electron transfer component